MTDIEYLRKGQLTAEQASERETLAEVINFLVRGFNNRCTEAERAANKRRQDALALREWKYSVKSLRPEEFGCGEGGYPWHVLHKAALNPVEGANDNEQWSAPFKILDGILFFSLNAYNGKCYQTPTKALGEQGFTKHTYKSLKELEW